MQLNKVLKGLMLAVPVTAMTACSAHKMDYNWNENEKEQAMATDAGTRIDMKSNNDISNDISSNEQARHKIKALHRNNIVYFDLDKDEIRSEFSKLLDAHANFLRSHLPDKKVTIEGHADERGTPEYNIALGERRAKAVKMYLQGKGVFSDQIAIVSYGKEKPAVLGHGEATYAKNRRAVLVYY